MPWLIGLAIVGVFGLIVYERLKTGLHSLGTQLGQGLQQGLQPQPPLPPPPPPGPAPPIPIFVPPPDIVLTDADGGKTIATSVGKQVRVQLLRSATTGYVWTPVGVAAGLSPVRQSVQNIGGGPGASVLDVFDYAVIGAGSWTLTFTLTRPFGGGVSPTRSYAVTIQANAGIPIDPMPMTIQNWMPIPKK